MTMDTHNGLVRLRTYPADEVFAILRTREPKQKKIILDGIPVGASNRVLTFLFKGPKCVKCGVKGVFFAIEKWPHIGNNTWHINLYGHREDGSEVMITKDHIVPRSKGGKNGLKNLQPMCKQCNERKGNVEPHK